MAQRLVVFCDLCGTDKNVSGAAHSLRTTVEIGAQAINGVAFGVRISIDHIKVPELCSKCSKRILLAACKQFLLENADPETNAKDD